MTGLAQPGMNLQATLAASSATADSPSAGHHPLACGGHLTFDEAGRFACDHTVVGPDDPRTHQAIAHSVAILLIELALDR